MQTGITGVKCSKQVLSVGFRSAGVLLLVAQLAACSLMGSTFRDKGNDYLSAKNLPRTVLPENVDEPPFNDVMYIPPIDDARGISGKTFQLPLPDPISSGYGIDKIVLKRLGNKHWIFLDAPTAAIWSQLREFWLTNNMAIDSEDPGRGYIETVWLPSREGSAEEIYEHLSAGRGKFDPTSSINNRFRMQVESGVRAGTSEVRIDYLTSKEASPGSANWVSSVDDLTDQQRDMRDKVLSSLAYHLGETINNRNAISLMASQLEEVSRTELVPDRVKPVLKYDLDFDRAWATVDSALQLAGIEIADSQKNRAEFHILYQSREKKPPGWFSRTFKRGDIEERRVADSYVVQLLESGEQVLVTIRKDETNLAEAAIAERLLTIIKEYST